jgi:hypothetical protein
LCPCFSVSLSLRRSVPLSPSMSLWHYVYPSVCVSAYSSLSARARMAQADNGFSPIARSWSGSRRSALTPGHTRPSKSPSTHPSSSPTPRGPEANLSSVTETHYKITA